MRAWHRKAVKDGIKALLPFQATLRRIKRQISPYTTDKHNDLGLLEDALRQIEILAGAGISTANARIAELGTGWNPTLPLMLSRCGAAQIITVDQERLLDIHTLRNALALLSQRDGDTQARMSRYGILPPFEEPLANTTLESALRHMRIDYRAPYDFLDLPEQSVDIVISRDVLEHIPETALRHITAHSRRILAPNGIICHTIDMSDHWEHKDKTISRLNFLQYEDNILWRMAGFNPQNYQNRLRRHEYAEIFQASGFEIIAMTGAPDERSLNALADMPLCKRYAALEHGELAILSTTIVARKTALK